MRDEKRPLRTRKFFYALKKYHWIHILILLLALFGGVLYLYLTPPLFLAKATLEITPEPLATEIDLLRSDRLIVKTLRDLGFDRSIYYTKEYRKRESYGGAPFKIENLRIKERGLYGKEIIIDPLSNERFSLRMKPSLFEYLDTLTANLIKRSKSDMIAIDGVYAYNRPIETRALSFVLKREEGFFEKGRYTLLFHDLSSLSKTVRTRLLDIHPASRGSHIVILNYRDATAKKAKDFLNRLMENYLRFRKREIQARTAEIIGKLSRNMANIDKDRREYLTQKLSDLMVERAVAKFERKILERAKADSRPLSPDPVKILLLSLFVGLFGVLLHALLRSFFDTKIKSPEDVRQISDLAFYGMIPYVKNGKSYNKAYVLLEPNSPASEAYRAIRNNLDYLMVSQEHKVILVTSSVPNEGKTTFSANLAAVLGMGEKQCILLSLDMRRPELHHKFGLSNKKGMSDLLSGRAELDEVTWEHEIYQNFDIVTSGTISPNPAELIASEKMKELIKELRAKYDYIVIDTPPLHLAADATILMQYADITLFVLKSEFSREIYLREIEELNEKLHLKNVGLILNSVKPKYNTSDMFDRHYIYFEAS